MIKNMNDFIKVKYNKAPVENTIVMSVANARQNFTNALDNAWSGKEVIIENRRINQKAVLVDMATLNGFFNLMKFSIHFEQDEKLNVYTVSVSELDDYYAEGETKDSALDTLVDLIIEECNGYIKHYDEAKLFFSAEAQLYIKKLIHGGLDKNQVKETLKNGGNF
ncbi:hypothetical protein F3D3_2151 [Fusibacter sp. 3D3]|nr:hypothetical protein F3D3_2151 [Fusibacter sp. 3D3]